LLKKIVAFPKTRKIRIFAAGRNKNPLPFTITALAKPRRYEIATAINACAGARYYNVTLAMPNGNIRSLHYGRNK